MIPGRASSREDGATLLSVLLLIVLMSTAALAATDALARSVSVARVSDGRADSFWAARGALSVGEAVLNEMLAGRGSKLTADSALLREPVVFPYPRGTIVVRFREASNCLNLNTLILGETDEGVSMTEPDRLRQMFEDAGLFSNDARELVDTLADWMDENTSPRAFGAEDAVYSQRDVPHRAPGQRLISLTELRAVKGYDPVKLAALDPMLCVRDKSENVPLNINTLTDAQAPLLTARFSSQLTRADAERLIESRPEGGWLNVEEFLLSERVAIITPDKRNDFELSTESGRIAADITVQSDTGTLRIAAEFERGSDGQFVLNGSHRRPG